MERVLRQERRLTARWERVDWASFERGRQMEELRMVPAESKTAKFSKSAFGVKIFDTIMHKIGSSIQLLIACTCMVYTGEVMVKLASYTIYS